MHDPVSLTVLVDLPQHQDTSKGADLGSLEIDA
jgi:hypothetical protein